MSRISLVAGGLSLCLLLTAGSLYQPPTETGTDLHPAAPATTMNSELSIDSIKANLRDYIWPTDAGTTITSTFAEYRSAHFHGGIDISTHGTTGYRVFAVREGYVCRIKILADGYGKMLFLKHPDGFVSTYAHLKGFSEEIESALRKEQYRRGAYSIDYEPVPYEISVHKGDVVAYTGDSGAGPPHLHFELRDRNYNLINPLLAQNYHMEDNIPPVLRRMMISPLTFGSTVDNSSSAKFYSRFPGRFGSFHNPQRPRIEGEIGFGIDAIDRANNTATHCGIHRLEFYFDDTLRYAMQLDKVPDEDTKEIDLHYDLPSITSGAGQFQKLYVDIGNSLPLYERRPEGSGMLNTRLMRAGIHHYRVVAVDYSGNRADLAGEVIVANKPVVNISGVEDLNVRVEGPQLAAIDRFIVQGRKFGSSRWNVHTLPADRFERSGNSALLPVNSRQYDILKIIGEANSGVESPPAFYFVRKPTGAKAGALLDVDPLRSYTRVTLTTKGIFTAPPNVLIKEGASVRSIDLEPVDVNRYVGAFSPSDAVEGAREVTATVEVNGAMEHLSKEFELFVIPPDRAGSFSYEYGSVLVGYDSAAVYQPLYMKISRDYTNGTPTYSFDPGDVLLKGGLRISLPRPENSRYKHLGLYYRYNNGWRFQTGTADGNRNYLTTKLTRKLGELAVFGDDQEPTFGKLVVNARKGILHVAFTFRDNLSGIDPGEIRMTLDGATAIPEVDNDRHRVNYLALEPLSRGKHTVRLTMPDRAGNIASVERTVTIK